MITDHVRKWSDFTSVIEPFFNIKLVVTVEVEYFKEFPAYVDIVHGLIFDAASEAIFFLEGKGETISTFRVVMRND